ncbi:MAG: flavoprotein [Gemmataceae bacterium]|nr:phosphopantothenoylcysteine decarboxylase [Gemmata sp.]MDW8196716.1 flavoprotein [Gemmataceae bacterium]
MARVLLGVTGSVAALRTPMLFEALGEAGHAVKVVATTAATYFFDPAALRRQPPLPTEPPEQPEWLRSPVFVDDDEWPRRADGERYRRGDPVLHIELRKWADLLLIAPLDANTLAKLAVGLCDNCLSCIWRAWDTSRPVVLAPAMNTLMWQHPLTKRHLRALAADAGAGHIPGHLADEALLQQINERSPTLRIVGPITKTLACGDTGLGAMAEVTDIVAAVQTLLTQLHAG